jgi:hypothetical protein
VGLIAHFYSRAKENKMAPLSASRLVIAGSNFDYFQIKITGAGARINDLNIRKETRLPEKPWRL